MDLFGGLKDKIVDKLSETEGDRLEISTYISNSAQMSLLVESFALEKLGSRYAKDRANKMMRLFCSWQGRSRSDLVEIGKAPETKKGEFDAKDF